MKYVTFDDLRWLYVAKDLNMTPGRRRAVFLFWLAMTPLAFGGGILTLTYVAATAYFVPFILLMRSRPVLEGAERKAIR
jgi:hypothetical protein